MSEQDWTFQEFRDFIDDASKRPQGWRYGQAAFNGLMSVRPALAELVRATSLDPFHDDEKVPVFYRWCEANWND